MRRLHSHPSRDGRRRLGLVTHQRDRLQDRPLLRPQVAHPVLIERSDPIQQDLELAFHLRYGFVRDQLIQHQGQSRTATGHSVHGQQSRAHVVEVVQQVRPPLPLEVLADQVDRFFFRQLIQNLGVEEIVKWFLVIRDRAEVQRRRGKQEASVVFHQKAAQSRDGSLILDLLLEHLVQIFQHDHKRLLALSPPLANRWHQRVHDNLVPLLRTQPLVEFRPARLIGQGVAQDLTRPQQEIRKREDAVRLFGEADHVISGGQRGVLSDLVFDQ